MLHEGAVPASRTASGALVTLAQDREGSRYVKLAATFFGPGRHWGEAWEHVPGNPNLKVAQRLLVCGWGCGKPAHQDQKSLGFSVACR